MKWRRQQNKSLYPTCFVFGVRKPWMIACVSLSTIVVFITLYTRLPEYRNLFFSPYEVNNFTLGDEEQLMEYVNNSDRNKDCFISPYVLCVPYSQLEAWKPPKIPKKAGPNTPNHDVTTNGTVLPVPVTTLVQHSYVHLEFKTFNFGICPLPCVYIPRHRVHEAKGVIVDGRFVRNHDFPVTRPEGQIYVVSVLESPLHFMGTLLRKNFQHKDQINLAMTYRVDSNIQFFYDGLCLNDQPRKTKAQLKKIYESKSRTAAWFVSNCHTPSKRMAYVTELQKYIDVDIYGRCGNKSYQKFGSERQILNSTYKFYLSFENSFCKDYVTEKFFKLFRSVQYIVPVVRGGMDYEKYFPPFTFINAGGFQTPADLGRYLKDVGGDFEKYVKFLETKEKYVAQPYGYNYVKRMCNVCRILHMNEPEVTKHYSDIGQWLSKGICYKAEENHSVYKTRNRSRKHRSF